MSDLIANSPPATGQPLAASEPAAKAPAVDWRRALATPEGRAALALLAGLLFVFVPLWRVLFEKWFEPDSLYSHGPLIPLMAAYIVYDRWPRLRTIPVKGVTLAIVPLLVALYITWFATRTVMIGTMSTMFLAALTLSVLFVGGWRWWLATLGPVLYLVFGLPLWTTLVDRVTQPLQALSTDMAMRMLSLFGLNPLRLDTTTVYLDHFQFNVAAACSGAKLTLALLAFSCFYILLNRGRWYSAVALLALLLPFSLLVNGLRIALVGVIGNAFGSGAGMAFHDYGGYVVLVVCFLLLGQITRILGFKQ